VISSRHICGEYIDIALGREETTWRVLSVCGGMDAALICAVAVAGCPSGAVA
jgi:hypothetical protein